MSFRSNDDVAIQRKTPVANNDTSTVTTRLTFEELVSKSGVDEETLLQRIANVLSRRTDDTVEKTVSNDAAE